MKHQPYETWVLMQEELTASQRDQLQAHLETCDVCRSLSFAFSRMENEISTVPMISPKEGFTHRWRERLAAENAMRKQRNVSILFGGLIFAISVLFVPILIQIVLLILSPEDLVISATNSAFNWLSWIGFAGDIAYAFAKSSIETFPAAWWGATGLFLMILTVIWFVSIHRFTPSKQIERSSQR
jgi:hypothetical protein